MRREITLGPVLLLLEVPKNTSPSANLQGDWEVGSYGLRLPRPFLLRPFSTFSGMGLVFGINLPPEKDLDV